jgi:hypothetical protein
MHFIGACEAELEAYQRRLKENRLGDVSPESVNRFVLECLQQADNIERNAGSLDDLDRARLLDLISRAAELRGHVRRSPRTVNSIPIHVRSEKPEQLWEERTETRLISRYGALVKCQHPVEIDQILCVLRLDTERKVDARVASRIPKKSGPAEAGIEFRNCDNFWELDWNRIVPQ